MTMEIVRDQLSHNALLYRFVATRAFQLVGGLASESSSARASLAVLRRSLSSSLAEQPQVWSEIFASFPHELEGLQDEPGVYEKAAHLALAFFALHQQSKEKPMHKEKVGFGTAIRSLISAESETRRKGIERRFNTVLTAQTSDELVHHLRGLIHMLRGAEIPLDYGQLAIDLVALNFPDSARRVRLKWARDMIRIPLDSADQESVERNNAETR